MLAAALTACGGGGGDDGGDGGSGSCPAGGFPGGTVTVAGRITYERVPFETVLTAGLDYASITAEPAREVIVEVISASNQSVLASTVTGADGSYTATVASNTSVQVRAKAQTRRATPGWDVRVLNNTNGNNTNGYALYVLDSTAFCTNAATITKDLLAASGWPDFGGTHYTGTRASGPFAIVDSIYAALQFLRANGGANLQLPALDVYWSKDNRGTGIWDPEVGQIASGTQYTNQPIDGFPAGIYVLGDEDGDTDEFDQHVIVHEFQHFLEDVLSRTESPAGPHSLHEELDMRLAFSEGYANAFAAMVLDDPIYRDSFGSQQSESFFIDFESNANSPAGFFNEGSVQSLVWDLYDSAADGSDTVSLGFAPMLDALTDELRNGSALVSLYPFVAALLADVGAPVADIDTLVRSQQVFGTGPYGSGETNFSDITEADPVYTPLALGGAAQRVCGTREAGTYNKLGNRLFLRFSLVSATNVTLRVEYTATGSQAGGPAPDPDLVLYQAGVIDFSQEEGPAEVLSIGLGAGDYVVEVYEYSHVDPDENASRRGITCMDVSIS